MGVMENVEKIIKIKGYIKKGESELLQVCWENKTVSWVPIQNVNSPVHVINFFKKIRDMCRPMENKVVVKEKEKSIISDLKKFKKKVDLSSEMNFKKRETVWNNRPKRFENAFKSGNEFNKRKNQGDLNKTVKKFGELNINEGMKNNKTNTRSDYRSNIANLNEERSPQFKTQNIVIQGKRYYEQPTNILQNTEISSEKMKNRIEFYVNGVKISMFNYTLIQHTDKYVNFKRFTASLYLDLKEIKILLFSIFQNPALNDLEIYNLDIIGNNSEFKVLCEKLQNEKLVVVDISSPNYLFVFVYGNILRQYEMYNNYNILRINRSYLDINLDNYVISKALEDTTNDWYEGSIFRNIYIENQLIFKLKDFENIQKSRFYIFSDREIYYNIMLKKTLIYMGAKPVSLVDNEISDIFIPETYIQYIYLLPKFHELLFKGCKFYKFNIKSDNVVQKIFQNGGVLTLDPELLKDLDVPNLLNLLKLIDSGDCDWTLKVQESFQEDFSKLLDEHKGRLTYHGINEVYKIIKKNVDNISCESVENYIKILASRYYIQKRFFFVLSHGSKGNFYKSPTDILEKYLKL